LFFATSTLISGGFPFGGIGFGPAMIAGMSYVFSPFIKAMLGFGVPSIGANLIFPRAGGPADYQLTSSTGCRQLGAAILLVSGGLTIPPTIIGGWMVLEPLVAAFGLLPFVPHVVGGTLLIAAGVLALLAHPSSPSAQTTFTSITARAQPSMSPPPGGYCHECGASLFGDEEFCPRCAHPLSRAQLD
jgi:hypothetical protein